MKIAPILKGSVAWGFGAPSTKRYREGIESISGRGVDKFFIVDELSHKCDNSSMKWTVEFLNDMVESEFNDLPEPLRASILQIAVLIAEYGLEKTGMPYVRHLQGKLWEMRGKDKGGIVRSIYIAVASRRVIIVRSFVKKTRTTPTAEIKIALKRAKEIE